MAVVTMRQLLESGVHFGHQTRRWNPKMKRFILTERNGIYVIDLEQSLTFIDKAYEFIKETVARGGTVMFVGTKRQAHEAIQQQAKRVGMPFVTQRWLGGMLTNLSTIRQSVKTLERIEKKISTGGEGFTKKEMILLSREQEKLNRNLSGIRSMRKVPGLLVVVDPSKEHIAVAEANKLGIPVMGLVDTNCDPDPIDHVIACNDDALKSIKLIIQSLTQAVIDKKKEMNIALIKGEVSDDKEAPRRKKKGQEAPAKGEE